MLGNELYFVAGRAAIGLKMEKAMFAGFFFIGCFLLWRGYFFKGIIIEQKVQIDSLADKLNQTKEVWCDMRGKTYCCGYAISVMFTSEGLIFPPSDSEKRVVTLISELQAQGIEVIIGAPLWKFIHSPHQGDVDHVYMLGAMYSVPKEVVVE